MCTCLIQAAVLLAAGYLQVSSGVVHLKALSDACAAKCGCGMSTTSRSTEIAHPTVPSCHAVLCKMSSP